MSSIPPTGPDAIITPPSVPLAPQKKEKCKLLWQQYGWDHIVDFDQLYTNHQDFFHFLKDSKLLYSIRGYQNSFVRAENTTAEAKPFKDAIQCDMHGHPSLFKEGQWVRWEDLKKEIEYSQTKKTIVSKNNDSVKWNFVYPNGLTQLNVRVGTEPVDTYDPEELNDLEPVYKLNAEELDRLKKFAGATEDTPRMIQVFTTESGLLKRISHAGLRLISETGDVYSFSFVTPNDEASLEDGSLFTFLSTYNVGITSPDFAEFDRFKKRRVTTIPLTNENFNNALNKVKAYAEKPLRFHFIHQNCGTFVADILNEAKIPINVNCWVGEFAWELAKDVPVLGAIVRTIDTIVKAIFSFLAYLIPKFIQVPILFAVKVITYIPFKILTILRNFLILSLGGATTGTPLRKGVKHDWDNSKGLTSFHTHISSWRDIFSDDIGKISSTGEIVNWQLGMQKDQTIIHTYDGSPSFNIVPPAIKI